MDMGKELRRLMRKEISSEEFARLFIAYCDTPEYRKKKASEAAKELKTWKAGRALLHDLINQAIEKGFCVDFQHVSLKDGHDSLLVTIEGGTRGYPSYFGPESVQESFDEQLVWAAERKAARDSVER